MTFSNIYFVDSSPAGEKLVASDNASGKYVMFQNNTANDLNLLLFGKPNNADKPSIFAVRAGGVFGWPYHVASFAVYTAQTEPPGDAIPPAGAGGTYNGPNKAPTGAIGYVSVIVTDEALAPISAGNPTTASASISGSLPAGTNNLGTIGLTQNGTPVDSSNPLEVHTNVSSVTATNVTIKDPTTSTNQMKVNADGSIDVQQTGSNAVNANVVSIATSNTAQQLSAVSCREITLIAQKGNSAPVYVGGSTVTDTAYGIELDPKDSFTFKVDNANLLYIYGAAGDGVSYVAV